MKTKKLLFTALLGFYVGFSTVAIATTSKTPPIDVSKLNAEKDYLGSINQCASPKLYSKVVDSALNTKDQTKHTIFAAQIEETIINNPACFVSAVSKMGYKKCEAIEENFVREPYFYPRHELYKALSTADNFGSSCFSS